ncbi:DUF6266 family protein [Pedobacter gandavensis]|uniref:DUF6266 family protein n=1 Tax=Pedobacter gandavensis TaxID=2679963 RepID=UPI00292F4A56|nr:DUF6266 family protein [Pedobacter gandavensis]
MAKCSVGPYGHPSGKIGNVVFYMLNGQPVCRLIGKAGKPSINQKGNRQSMSVTMELIKPMADFIGVSFKLEAEGSPKNTYNLAVSYNKKHALTGQYPNIKVDYSKIILSKGNLEMAKDLKLTKGEDGINLSWNTATEQYGYHDDIMMVMISHPVKKTASNFLNVAKRSDGSCFIPLYHEWMMSEQMEVYVCVRSADEKSISNSVYVGNLNGVPDTESEIAEKANYQAIKARFDQVANDYHEKRMVLGHGGMESKAFRQVRKEYQVLKEKLEHLPGKPS